MDNFWANRPVLVAGGSGLFGQAAIRKLIRLGADIRATEGTHRKIDAEFCHEIDVRYTDLRWPDQDLYDGIDTVIWCAAKVGGAKSILESPSDLINYNLQMTAENLNRAVKAGVKRVGYVSSSYVYPHTGAPNKEDDLRFGDVPRIHYGLGWIKRYIETLCKHYQMTSDTRFGIIRPTSIYGPYDNFDPEASHMIPATIRKVAEGQNPLEIWGDGKDVRQFCYVDDVVDGLLAVVENYCVAEPLNICREQTNVVDDVWTALLRITGKTFEPLPDFSTGIVRFYPQGVQVTHNIDKPSVIPYKVSDPSRAKELLGFECKTDLETGLRLTYDWYLQHR
jgi:GDP-L-fucose synthase